jgi:release factor glutamine methyltransferase
MDPTPTDSPARSRELEDALAERLGSRREARWILEHGDAAPDLAERRAGGEPLQYVLGRWPFRWIELDVDPRVLIPRPETEQVVEVALAELDRAVARSGRSEAPGGGPVVADLGTGSGAIALSLAVEGGATHRSLEVWGAELSEAALEVAHGNLARLSESHPGAARRVALVRGDWFAALPGRLAGRLDLVVCNPPYVSEEEFPLLDPVVRDWEPRRALVAADGAGGVGGMADIESVIGAAPDWLSARGVLVVEIAPHQVAASTGAALRAGFARVDTARDLSGRDRMLVARR